MELKTLIAEVEEYATRRGIHPGTVCRDAVGQFRLYDRLKRRADRIEIDAQRLREYMASNPVTPDGPACLSDDNTADTTAEGMEYPTPAEGAA